MKARHGLVVLLVTFVPISACESAALGPRDGATPDHDARPLDGGPIEDTGSSEDGGPIQDSGALDAADGAEALDGGLADAARPDAADGSRPRAPSPPAPPTAPGADPSPIGAWLESGEPEALAAADPRMESAQAPRFSDCGTWRRVADDGAEVCEPWPATGRATCTGASEHLPGGPACTRVGSECPAAGSWDPVVAAMGGPTVVYVRSGAPSGGAGTQSAPFATLQEALAAAPANATIALSEGTYEGPVALAAGQTLWGACVERTIVTGPATPSAIVASGANATVRNLQVRSAGVGVEAPRTTGIVLDRVLVEGGTEGLYVSGGSIEGTDVVVRDTSGPGAHVNRDGRLALTRAVIRGSANHGLVIDGALESHPATSATLTEVAIVDSAAAGISMLSSRLDADGLVIDRARGGDGIHLFGGSIGARKVVVRDVVYTGIQMLSGSSTSLASLLVERTGTAGVLCNTPTMGAAWVVRDAATGVGSWATMLTIDAVRIERSQKIGLSIWESANVTATSIDVRQSGLETAGRATMGTGIAVTDRAALTLRRSRVDGARGAGVTVGGCIAGECYGDAARMGVGTMATILDLSVTATLPSRDGALPGYGVLVTGGARGDLTRALLAGDSGAAVAVGYAGVGHAETLAGGTLAMHDVMARASATALGGVLATDGSTITGGAVVVSGARASGIEARDPMTSVTLDDVVVADTVAAAGGSRAGRAGIAALQSASVTSARVWVLRSEEASVRAAEGATTRLTDVSLGGTTLAPAGFGVLAESASSVTLTRAELFDLERAGIEARGEDTTLELNDVSVARVAEGDGGVRGLGLFVHQGAAARAAGLLVAETANVAVLVADRGSTLDASDLSAHAGAAGVGTYLVVVGAGASAEITGALLEDGRGLGAGAFGGAASLTLTDVLVMRTRELCEASSCVGTGLGAYGGARVQITRFSASGASRVGAQLDDASTMVLTDGVISMAPVGVELPAEVDASTVVVGTLIERCDLDVSRTPSALPPAPDPAR